MIWYKYLYLGETAKKHRFSILQKLRLGKVQPGVHVITPASGGHNLLDILPAYVLRQKGAAAFAVFVAYKETYRFQLLLSCLNIFSGHTALP